MRIRKHAKISSSLSISPFSTTLKKDICELYRSPWDVLLLAPQSYLSSHPIKSQDEDEETVTVENGSGRVSVGIVARLKEPSKVKENKQKNEEKSKRICSKKGGKGCECWREAKGHSLCAHHLTQRRSYRYESCRKSDLEEAALAGTRHNNNPSRGGSDFYYDSGFGPRWGKKRKRGGMAEMDGESMPLSWSNQGHVLDFKDHSDDDRDENDIIDDGYWRKKRGRKPMKSRSLKSLL
ncbi:uncharacterized protein LOC143857440 [Tasmannia lanceolata]|uniref:uncharacterized protein LOC143857440 n=1 Tax=Tasmannia lanceolata TaxID=3420 RepID=UPI004064415C